jgi:hypothetical protein
MSAPEGLRRALAPVLAAFEAERIRWYLTGSTASVFYGVPRATMDVDVVAELRPAHVRPLVAALGPAYYVSEDAVGSAVRRGASFNVIHNETGMKVDVFVLRDAPYEREAFARRRRADVVPFGPCFVPSPEDVLLSKLLWYEKGGRASDRQWSDVLGILRAQEAGLDHDYLARWARDLGLTGLLEAATREARPRGGARPRAGVAGEEE